MIESNRVQQIKQENPIIKARKKSLQLIQQRQTSANHGFLGAFQKLWKTLPPIRKEEKTKIIIFRKMRKLAEKSVVTKKYPRKCRQNCHPNESFGRTRCFGGSRDALLLKDISFHPAKCRMADNSTSACSDALCDCRLLSFLFSIPSLSARHLPDKLPGFKDPCC